LTEWLKILQIGEEQKEQGQTDRLNKRYQSSLSRVSIRRQAGAEEGEEETDKEKEDTYEEEGTGAARGQLE
jgi:hypothetical protein